MLRKIGESFLYCGIAGIIIECILVIAYYLIFPNIQETRGLYWLDGITIGCCILVSCMAIYKKNRSFWMSLFRWFTLFLSYVVSFLMSAFIGVVPFLLKVTGTVVEGVTGNVVGLSTGISVVFIFGFTLIIILIRAVVVIIYRIIKWLIQRKKETSERE